MIRLLVTCLVLCWPSVAEGVQTSSEDATGEKQDARHVTDEVGPATVQEQGESEGDFKTEFKGVHFDERFDHWPVQLKIGGRILVDNQVTDIASLEQLLARLTKDKSVAVFAANETPVVQGIKDSLEESAKFAMTELKKADNGNEFPTDAVKAALNDQPDQQIVVLALDSNSRESLRVLRPLQAELAAFVEQGGTLLLDAASAEAAGAVLCGELAAGDQASEGGTAAERDLAGLGLLLDSALDCEFVSKEAQSVPTAGSRERLLAALSRRPRTVGIGLTKGTLLVLSGRKMTCYGEGSATFVLTAGADKPQRREKIVERESRRQPATEYLVDLTEWRRDAIDRTLPAFPPAEPAAPYVDRGTLVIVGGGGMPQGLMTQIVELAGGVEEAKMVYVPCAESDDVEERQRTVEMWKRMGVKHATFIHTKDRNRANSDEEFLAPLKDATGIWFGGGRQWNFADSYYGTTAHRLMKDVLKRGGVIGGSSAGASIQGRYLARATPIGNFRIMAPGYERGGLGFLNGVAIDQHFSQRGRQPDMTRLVNRYPQLLGIGIDEATALIVKKSVAEVVGRGKVFFYDRRQPVVPDTIDFTALAKGSSYDLVKRKVIIDATAESENGPDKTTDD